MTTATFTAAPRNHNLTWMDTVHDQLVAFGLVQTSDTGQLTMPPTWVSTANNNYGYTVYRWDDTLQGTYPLFMKIEWRNSADTAGDGHSITVHLGTGTDGAGTFTGPTFSVGISGPTTTVQSASTFASYLCYLDSALTVSLFESDTGSTGNGLFFAVDRMRDADGTANADGAVCTYYAAANQTGVQQRYFSVVSGTATNATQTPVQCFVPYAYFNTAASLALSDDIPVFGHTFLTPHANQLLAVVTVPQADVAADNVFTVTRLGDPHTYRATGTRTNSCGYCPSTLTTFTPGTGSSALSLAYLYE